MSPSTQGLACEIVRWQRREGRHALPWQQTRDPYRVWVSEIMLQQTQVATVRDYYLRFMARFPDVDALAAAEPDAVLGAWSGLGYYSRARNLHEAARRIAARRQAGLPRDGWPDTVDGLQALPGIGRSTAAAIAVFCFDAREPILDGNVKRVFARLFGVEGPPSEAATAARLWSLAESAIADPALAAADCPAYIQGLMDLGATLCTRSRPDCGRCPLATRCVAFRTDATARLPARRAARPVPERAASLLLIRRDAMVWLERRAARGLWGGLWSLPELAWHAECTAAAERTTTADRASLAPVWAARVAALTGQPAPPLPAEPCARFGHAFTHFRLQADVWCVVLPPGCPVPGSVAPELVALDLRDARAFAEAPLPGPVRTLLAALAGPTPAEPTPQRILRSARKSRTR